MKVLAILQARMSSSRLPGKVLKCILGKPMLWHQIERIKRSSQIDRLIVATSIDGSDDELERFCETHSIDCFRGSLVDVLDRYYQAAQQYDPEHVVRLTGDCPLIDPELIDLTIERHIKEGADYTSNSLTPTYPDGLDVEVVKSSVLFEAWASSEKVSEREHVTLYIRNNADRYKICGLVSDTDNSSMRWTVDEFEDFEFVNQIYKRLYASNPNFSSADVIKALEFEPELQEINSSFLRNEGLTTSLARDEKV
ncbi:glycosyltransferase family protein [bacterium SCSIO 12696]|uniref:glycosyltransferase family protein n=1 Tax=Porticoccus sp. W117 TaxID=3054777 RepID=UPI0021FAAA30|nr:glycosyltransferase family protein [Porticoccus sp. W117]MDM3872385.1 glycosyltransferase family protein [Porticoccus sp. W117]UTW46030.1 glycosyltransferase family protein [bacterium SCSIO 12696]